MTSEYATLSFSDGNLTSTVFSSDIRCTRTKDACDQSNPGNDSNLLIVFYVQIMPDDFVMQLHRF